MLNVLMLLLGNNTRCLKNFTKRSVKQDIVDIKESLNFLCLSLSCLASSDNLHCHLVSFKVHSSESSLKFPCLENIKGLFLNSSFLVIPFCGIIPHENQTYLVSTTKCYSLTTTPSQLHPHNYTLTTTPSQLHPHNYTLTTTPSQLHPHNYTLTTTPSQLLITTTPSQLHPHNYSSQLLPHNYSLTITPSQILPHNCTLTTTPSQLLPLNYSITTTPLKLHPYNVCVAGVVEFLNLSRVAANHEDFKDLGYEDCLRKLSTSDNKDMFTHGFNLMLAYAKELMPYTNYT